MAWKPFYEPADWAYHLVMDGMPESVQKRSEASAFMLGAEGVFFAAKGLQWVSRNFMHNVITGFHEDWLPKLETACAVAVVGGPVLYGVVDPEAVREIITESPTYASGMAGVALGGLAAAGKDVYKVLDDIVAGARNAWKRMTHTGPTLLDGTDLEL